jgi:hypothetical protein
MQSRVAGSRIVVLASHSLGLVRDVCNRGLVLDRGRLWFDGGIDDALKRYHELVMSAQAQNGSDGEHLQTVGALEGLALDGDRLLLRGWALQGFIAMPPVLALDVAGERHVISTFSRHARPDVQHHFGLHDPVCGFEAELRLPGLDSLAALGRVPAMFGGSDQNRLDGPFRVAPAVLARQAQLPAPRR